MKTEKEIKEEIERAKSEIKYFKSINDFQGAQFWKVYRMTLEWVLEDGEEKSK